MRPPVTIGPTGCTRYSKEAATSYHGKRPSAVELDQIFLDAASVGRVGLERQILLEGRLRPHVVLLLVVEERQLAEWIGKGRIELGGPLVPLQRLLRLVGLVRG